MTTLRTSVLHFFKHAHLMRERMHIQQGRVDIVLQALAFTAGNIRLSQGSVELLFLLVRGGVKSEIAALPVAFKQAFKLADQAGRNRVRDANIPLQAVSERGTGRFELPTYRWTCQYCGGTAKPSRAGGCCRPGS